MGPVLPDTTTEGEEGEEATTPTPAPAPDCSGEFENCAISMCCKDVGLFCYKKDEYWAGCRPDCNIGVHEHDVYPWNTPWTCDVLDLDPSAPEPTGENLDEPMMTTS